MSYEGILPPGARIKVIGVGGGGGNAVNTMIRSELDGVEFAAINTDVQALRFALPDSKIQIGKELTKGLGAGADPDVGRDAALEDRQEIQEIVSGADMVFVTAGMGGGTGTGGAAIVAQIAREMGALTVGVITKPFNFEGKRRRKHAEAGIERLRECVDTLITIPNQRLLQIATPDLSMVDAFRMADDVLVNAVKGISDIINIPGTINVDFADVKSVMSSMGMALMGIGSAKGENRAVEAAKQAISSPLLEDVDIEGATGILINITAGSNVSLMEVNEACSIIQDAAHEDANIIFGAVIDENINEDIRVTVIATGFPADYDDIAVKPVTRRPTVKSERLSDMTFQQSASQKPVEPVQTNPEVPPAAQVSAQPQVEPSTMEQPVSEDPAKLNKVVEEIHFQAPQVIEKPEVKEEEIQLQETDTPTAPEEDFVPAQVIRPATPASESIPHPAEEPVKRAAAFAENFDSDSILSELPPMDSLFDDVEEEEETIEVKTENPILEDEDLDVPAFLRKGGDLPKE